jgi:flavorubredoxin
MVIQIAEGIYDVGVTDWNIRDFHGYSTHRGTSYNAYLILDEKIALVDTVKKEFSDQLLDNIAEIVDPGKIDMVISNHTEMDHSGGLPRVMHRIGEKTPIVCSKMGQKNLSRHFSQPWEYRPVKNGDTLSLGKRTLTFMETRMVHWPDSMFTYLKEDEILFSSDGFGQHFASFDKFDDQVGEAIMPHAKKYFANILLLYAPLILKIIDSVVQSGLSIKMICPDHGIIWRDNPGKIIDAYARWSRQEAKNKAVLVYDTMWHSTEEMALAIASGIRETGAAVVPMYLKGSHRSDVMTEILDAGAVVIGSPTLNNQLFPTISDMLTYMKGLKPKNKLAAAFGSYGWSGEAVKLINQEFEAMDMTLVDDGLRIQYVPTKEHLQACHDYGLKIGKALKG